MITPRFREALEKYQRRRWFPELYPNALPEFSDYISEEFVRSLTGKGSEIISRGIAEYLARLLPDIRFPGLRAEFLRSLKDPLKGSILPSHAFYYIRSDPNQQSSELWKRLQAWCEKWETAFKDWLGAQIGLERSLSMIPEAFFAKELADTRDLFAWKLEKAAPEVQTLDALVRFFRCRNLDAIADWNDFPALAKAISESERIRSRVDLRVSAEKATQFIFPVEPPKRVVLQYGTAAGPVDAIRFVTELGRAFFYSGIDPDLPFEKRVCGDAALPYFWGYVQALIFSDRDSLGALVPNTEALSSHVKLLLEFRFRYEVLLSIYRHTIQNTYENIRDSYVQNFQQALPLSAPSFLYLYDLDRSHDAGSRAAGLHAAVRAVERFREKYGKRWFTNSRFSEMVRDYWRLGFSITVDDLLKDLGAPPEKTYPF